MEGVNAAIKRLEEIAAEGEIATDVVEAARAQHQDRLQHIFDGTSDQKDQTHGVFHDEVERSLIDTERRRINELFRDGKLNDEARRRIERELDMREVSLPKTSRN
jgi:CPA1 family monovalent cation:H+ antiporter